MIDVGSARGRKPGEVPDFVVVRPLGEEDLEMLIAPGVVGSVVPTVAKLSHSHHALAQALARGVSAVEAGLIAGYSSSRISILKNDPAFAELLQHYAGQRELVQIDVLERMRVLGLNSIEELQGRLESKPEDFTPRELMEMTELMLVKGRAAPGSRQGPGPTSGTGSTGVTVQVQFVTADKTPMIESSILLEGNKL